MSYIFEPRSLLFVILLLVGVFSHTVHAQDPAQAEIFVRGEKFPSVQAYLDRDLSVKDVPLEQKTAPLEVVGVSPSLKDIVHSFQGGVVVSPPVVVGSFQDVEEDIKTRFAQSDRPLLMVADQGRIRFMELQMQDEDPPL